MKRVKQKLEKHITRFMPLPRWQLTCPVIARGIRRSPHMFRKATIMAASQNTCGFSEVLRQVTRAPASSSQHPGHHYRVLRLDPSCRSPAGLLPRARRASNSLALAIFRVAALLSCGELCLQFGGVLNLCEQGVRPGALAGSALPLCLFGAVDFVLNTARFASIRRRLQVTRPAASQRSRIFSKAAFAASMSSTGRSARASSSSASLTLRFSA